MIPGTLALAFSMTLVPLVAASFHKGRIREVHHHLTAVFQVLLFLVVPACLGIALLAVPLYTIFMVIIQMVRCYYSFCTICHILFVI